MTIIRLALWSAMALAWLPAWAQHHPLLPATATDDLTPHTIGMRPYECFDFTISTKSARLVKRGCLVVSIPQPDCLFSAATSCRQVPHPEPAADVGRVTVIPHPLSCPACLRVGGVVLQQDSRSQDWPDAFHAVSDVAPIRNHTCDSTRESGDEDWICSVTICLTIRSGANRHKKTENPLLASRKLI
jgi:hypothetical protein